MLGSKLLTQMFAVLNSQSLKGLVRISRKVPFLGSQGSGFNS